MDFNQIIKLCRDKYNDEVKNGGTDWRFMQLTTFADLIHLESINVIKTKKLEKKILHAINIFNLSIKALIQIENGIVELTDNYENDKTNIYLSISDALNFYDNVWLNQEIIQEITKYSLYHKKGITGNSNSYFSHIFSLSIN